MVPTRPEEEAVLPAHDIKASLQRLYDRMVDENERLEEDYLEKAQANSRQMCFLKALIAFCGVVILVLLAVIIVKITGRGRRPSPTAPDANETALDWTAFVTGPFYSNYSRKEVDAEELPEGSTDLPLSVPLGGE